MKSSAVAFQVTPEGKSGVVVEEVDMESVPYVLLRGVVEGGHVELESCSMHLVREGG
jgi:hypothetical protein